MTTRSWLRRARLAALGVAAAALALVVAVHTPYVRGRVLQFVIAQIANSGFVARAERLDYNLATRTIRLANLSLAAPATSDAPFFSARDVVVTIPWSALRGTVGLDHVAIVSPRITLRRDANGRDNWTPGPHDTSSSGPLSLHIGRATATDIVVDWDDAQATSRANAVLSVDLAATPSGIAGPIVFAAPAAVQWRDRRTAIEVTSGVVSWNDRDLAVTGVALRAPEGTVRLDARIDEVLGAARIGANVDADANLATLSPWLELERAIEGHARATARIDGTGVDIASLRTAIAGGEATVTGRIGFDGTGTAHATWTRLDLPAILRMALATSPDVAPASTMTGNLDARWTSSRLDDLQLTAKSQLTGERIEGRRHIPIDASVAIELQRLQWKLTSERIDALGIRAVTALTGTLNAGDLQQSSIAGTLNARTIDDREWPRALARAGLVDAELAVTGPIATDFTVAGTFGSPSLDGRLDTTLQQRSMPASTVRGRLAITKDALALSDIDAQMAGTTARGSVRWGTASDAISGALTGTLRLRDLAVLIPSLPSSLVTDGTVDVSAELGGSTARPRVAIEGNGQGLEISGQTIDRFTTGAHLDGRQLTIERLRLDSEGGQLEATATVDLARETYTTRATATHLPIHPLLDIDGKSERPLNGQLNGTFEGSGTFQQLGGRGRLSMTSARWRDADFGTATSDVALAGQTATFTLDAPDVALTANGSVGIDAAGAMAVTARWEPRDVAAVAKRLAVDMPLSGSVALTVEWTGTRDHPDRGQAKVGVNAADLTLAGQAFRLAQPGRIDVDGGSVIRVTPIAIATGTSTLTIDGTFGEAGGSQPLTLTLDGSLADFGFVRDLVQPRAEGEPAPPPLAGSIHGAFTAEGGTQAPRIAGGLEVRDGRVPITDRAQVSGIELGARVSDGVVVVDRASAAFEGATLAATARVPSAVFLDRLPEAVRRWIPTATGPATLNATLQSLTPTVMAPFVDPSTLEQIALYSDATIDLEADRPDLDRLRGAVVLSRAELSLAGVAFDQQTPTRLSIGGGRVTIDTWNWGRGGNTVALRGGLALAADPALDLTANAALDLRLLNAFSPAARTAGRADAEIRLTGTAQAPAIDGYLTISDGETRVANPRLVVDDITGTALLTGDTISLRGVSATLNGGAVEATGSIHHRWFVPQDGSLAVTAKSAALDISGLRAEADSTLTWTLDANSSTIGGTVTLVRSAYRDQITIAGNLLNALRRSSTSIAAADPEKASVLARTRLDVRLLTDEDLLVDNNVARLTVHGDLRAVGPVTNPSMTGRMTFGEGGAVFFNGTRYRLSDRRSIDFANPTRIEPDLDLSAVARVQGEDISIALRGTPATLETTIDSENKDLSQSDRISLLLVGRKASQGEANSEDLVGLLTGNFLEAAGRAVGFDSARIERGSPDLQFDAGLVATETDPGTRLTFGKTIGSHVELVFSQSLQQSGGLTWIVGYKPRAGIDLRLVTLDEGDRLYTFSHAITFGGPTRTATTKTTPTARVASVSINGAGADEAALRSRLKLKAGDRFSFFEWQDDRERLERFFHQRQRFEARIAARRLGESAEASRIQLVYDVRPGPQTTIAVEGYELSQSSRESIEGAWTRSVVDDFLIEEVATIARAELADDGYLLPKVAVRIDGNQARQLHVAITPGTRSRSRRVEFTGNINEPSSRLLAILVERELTRSVWTNPDAVGRALRTFYRSNGYLRAEVRVGDITVTEDAAIRPIQIVEGPAFSVGTVRVEGIHAFTTSETAEHLAGMTPGERYTTAHLESAQAALDTRYRARGYNRVGIDYQAAITADATDVDIVVRVDEGPQQRLRAVNTQGLTRTKPTLLSRALNLEIGEPVDLAAWNAARRRAYETGAFRSVDIQREVLEAAAPAAAGAIGPVEEAVRANVTVQEWPPLRLRYGLEVRDELAAAGDAARSSGADTSGGRTFGLGIAGDLGTRGLFGRAISAGVAGRYSADLRVARVYVTSPLFFGRPIATTFFIERSREETGDDPDSNVLPFVTSKTDVTIEQRIRFARRTTATYGYTREQNHTRFLDPTDPFDLTETIGYFTSAAIVDTRDDPLDATGGWFHSSNLQYAPALGSTQRFVRYYVQQQYFRHAHRVVFATAVRVGLAKGLGLPLVPSKRFFAGGGNSVRGYAEDVLTPTNLVGEAIGGNALLVVNQEVRFPIVKYVRGVGFFDAGRVFDGIGNISLADLAPGAGLGLRIQTPFVLVRVDAGVPFDSAFGPRRARWFFSIGQMF